MAGAPTQNEDTALDDMVKSLSLRTIVSGVTEFQHTRICGLS